MSWLLAILTFLLLLDALRVRGRVDALPLLDTREEHPPAKGYHLVAREGVQVPDALVRAAADWARAEGLDVVDLMPSDLPTDQALGLLQLTDVARYREDAFAPGRTAAHALIVSDDVMKRAQVERTTIDDPADMVRLARDLKRFAPRTSAMAATSDIRAWEGRDELHPATRARMLRAVLGKSWLAYQVGAPVLLVLLLMALITEGIWGVLAFAAYHAVPLIAFSEQHVKPRDLVRMVAMRIPWELWMWARTVRADPGDVERRRRIDRERPAYAQLLAGGIDRFLEPRRDTCPLCEGRELSEVLRSPDMLQHKPGEFHLEACGSCGHVFQNPRLSVEGLGFYYRDFYDGLGREELETLFATGVGAYHDRARALHGAVEEPERWLDVGTGQGHFCLAARDIWPRTRFDGLDLSDNVDEAGRRRWVDRALHGLFPEVAPRIEGTYDVVSMSHYLEHTREPVEELEAAHRALRSRGHLLIEVPDPACRTGRILGRFWMPWFQPQHQHLVPADTLERLLADAGFEVVWRDHAGPHQPVDLMLGTFIFLHQVGPPPDLPWGAPPTTWDHVRHRVTWTLGMPLVLAAWVVDRLTAPLLRRPGWSNTYRLLARRAD